MQTILWSLSPNNEPPMALDKESESIDSSSKEDDRVSDFSDEYIDFPSDKKRCPRGYSSKIYKNKKVCKKNKTRKKK
jgi:hypothetical protein